MFDKLKTVVLSYVIGSCSLNASAAENTSNTFENSRPDTITYAINDVKYNSDKDALSLGSFNTKTGEIKLNKFKKVSGWEGEVLDVFQREVKNVVLVHEDKHRENRRIINNFDKDKIAQLSLEEFTKIAVLDEVLANIATVYNMRSEYEKNGFVLNPYDLLTLTDSKAAKSKYKGDLSKLSGQELAGAIKFAQEDIRKSHGKCPENMFDFYVKSVEAKKDNNAVDLNAENSAICMIIKNSWMTTKFPHYKNDVKLNAYKMYQDAGGKGTGNQEVFAELVSQMAPKGMEKLLNINLQKNATGKQILAEFDAYNSRLADARAKTEAIKARVAQEDAAKASNSEEAQSSQLIAQHIAKSR